VRKTLLSALAVAMLLGTSRAGLAQEELKPYASLLPYVGFSAAAGLTFSVLDRLFLVSRYERIRS